MLLGAIFIPIFGSLILPAAAKLSPRIRNLLALFLAAVPLFLSLSMLPSVFGTKALTFGRQLAFGFNLNFTADGLAVFMACVSSLISFIILIYSLDYISHYENQSEYYLMVVLFLGSMIGLVFSANLIFLYVFWELTAVTSWRLIGFFRKKQDVLRANKAFLITVFGALMMLLGFIMLYHDTGSFDLQVIKEAVKANPVSNLTVIFILIGIFAKSATLPLHTWLPDAGVAPSPVTALLHAAVLVKIGVYVFARIFVFTIPLDLAWQTIIPTIAAISALVAAGAALIETDLKRIIAYSTVSQIGFIFLGFSTGSAIGIAGALSFILMHGLAKAGLFLSAGIVEQNAKVKDIRQLGGLAQTMPVTAFSFLACAFCVMSIPPFGGFFSKYMVISGAFNSGHLLCGFIFLLGAVLTILYLLRTFNMVFLGEARIKAGEGSFLMVLCTLIFACLSLAGGIFIKYPNQLINEIVKNSFFIK